MSRDLVLTYATDQDVEFIEASVLTPESKFGLKAALNSPAAIAYTLKDSNGKVLAILGGYFMYSKVMEIWTYVDKSVDNLQFGYARILRDLIPQMFYAHSLKRMQFTVRASAPWSERWIRFLGFKIETCMNNYGEENESYYLASRTEA